MDTLLSLWKSCGTSLGRSYEHGKEKYINEKTKNVLKDRACKIETQKKENLTLVSLIAKRHKEKHF